MCAPLSSPQACFDQWFLNFMLPKEISTYNSTDGEYSLVFEQMGDPQWPFGPTDVRLTLKNYDGKIIERASTQLSNDGGNAGEHNIAFIKLQKLYDACRYIAVNGKFRPDKTIQTATIFPN